MTINPESVKAYARELLEAEERGRREVNAELLAACKLARAELAWLKTQTKAREGGSVDRALKACESAIRAERQGEAMEVAGNRGN